MHHFRYMVLMNLFLCILSSNCNVFSTIQVIPGYRCFADKQMFYTITPAHHYSCTLSCITNKRCLYVLHHVVRNYCLVSNGPCLWLEPDPDYNVVVYRAKLAHECVDWVPKTRLINAARKQDTCVSQGREHSVGRANIQSNILLGSGGDDILYTVLNGSRTKSSASEWLDVQPGCHQFNTGTPQPVYVMGAVKSGGSCTRYGYNSPGTGRGYFEFWRVHECTEMYLMIIEQ